MTDQKTLRSDRINRLGHRIGTSRRELLGYGAYSFASYLTMPSLLSVIVRSSTASAQTGNDGPMVPFICFDMAGGAALPGNALVGKAGGPDDLLKSYNIMGWDPRAANANIDRRFGLPMAGNNVSGLLAGMISVMSPEAQQRLRLGSACHFSRLDSGENPQNAAALALALGAKGSVFFNGLKAMRTVSGGQSRSVIDGTAFSPAYVADVSQLAASLSFGGAPLLGMGTESLKQLSAMHRDLTRSQVDAFQSESSGDLLKEKVEAFLNEPDLAQVGIDPRENAVAASIWGISRNSQGNSPEVVQATISTCVIDGISGPGVWTLGGCDYHDQTSTTGDQKDSEMGQAIGRAVEYAHRQGKPLFFQLITDGSCDSLAGTRIWTGDTNEGMQIFGYYRPDGAPSYTKANMQIGHFNDAQAAERSTLIGADPKLASLAVFANYCNIQGRLGEFMNYSRAFTNQELDSLIVFAEG